MIGPMRQTDPAAGPGYLRVLSRFDASMLVIGSIIGGGVFFTPNYLGSIRSPRSTPRT